MSSIKQISVNSNTYDIHDTRITGVDSTPTASSGNVVTSGGVKTALDGKVAKAGDTMTGSLQINAPRPDLLILKSTDSSGGAYIELRPLNQTTNLWRIGANTSKDFELYYSTAANTWASRGSLTKDGNLTVEGDIRAKGNDIYVGSASNSQCHQQYDATNKCLKFIFD